MMSAHVGVECPHVLEHLDQLEVIGGWVPGDQGEYFTPGSFRLSATNCLSNRSAGSTKSGMMSICVTTTTPPKSSLCAGAPIKNTTRANADTQRNIRIGAPS